MVTREDYESMCSGRDVFCSFCEADECEKCMITRLLNDAFNELPQSDQQELCGM